MHKCVIIRRKSVRDNNNNVQIDIYSLAVCGSLEIIASHASRRSREISSRDCDTEFFKQHAWKSHVERDYSGIIYLDGNKNIKRRRIIILCPPLFIAVFSRELRPAKMQSCEDKDRTISSTRFSVFLSPFSVSTDTLYKYREVNRARPTNCARNFASQRKGCWKSSTTRAKATLVFPRHCKRQLIRNQRERGRAEQ